MWEISSGRPPFYSDYAEYGLALNIINGAREETINNTPIEYSNLYKSKKY